MPRVSVRDRDVLGVTLPSERRGSVNFLFTSRDNLSCPLDVLVRLSFPMYERVDFDDRVITLCSRSTLLLGCTCLVWRVSPWESFLYERVGRSRITRGSPALLLRLTMDRASLPIFDIAPVDV